MKPGDTAYAERLDRLSSVWWKRALDVQRPYRMHIERLKLGRTLDIGCGIGRNLRNLGPESVGIDMDRECIAVAKARGLVAYTCTEFWQSDLWRGQFDSFLVAHVLEHMVDFEGDDMLRSYLQMLRDGGRVVLITPQEAGFVTDATHVRFVDFEGLAQQAETAGLKVERQYSFPFPRVVGKFFPYNEFVTICRK